MLADQKLFVTTKNCIERHTFGVPLVVTVAPRKIGPYSRHGRSKIEHRISNNELIVDSCEHRNDDHAVADS